MLTHHAEAHGQGQPPGPTWTTTETPWLASSLPHPLFPAVSAPIHSLLKDGQGPHHHEASRGCGQGIGRWFRRQSKKPMRYSYYFIAIKITATKQKWGGGSQGKEQAEPMWTVAQKRFS